MKTSNFLVAVIALLFSCQETKPYTQQLPEIEVYKNAIEAIENRDWKTIADFYTDSAKIIYNKSLLPNCLLKHIH